MKNWPKDRLLSHLAIASQHGLGVHMFREAHTVLAAQSFSKDCDAATQVLWSDMGPEELQSRFDCLLARAEHIGKTLQQIYPKVCYIKYLGMNPDIKVRNAHEEAYYRWQAVVKTRSRGQGPGMLPELAILGLLCPVEPDVQHAACMVQMFQGSIGIVRSGMQRVDSLLGVNKKGADLCDALEQRMEEWAPHDRTVGLTK